MSIIFKTLEKIRLQSSNKTGEKEGADKYKNNYPLGKIIFSPFTMLVCALMIFILGVMAMYGVRYLKTYVKKKNTLFVSRQMVNKDNRAEKSGQEKKEKKEESLSGEKQGEIPLPPENISGEPFNKNSRNDRMEYAEPNQRKTASFSLEKSKVPVYTEKLRDDFYEKAENSVGSLEKRNGLHFSPARERLKDPSPLKIPHISNRPVATLYLPGQSGKEPLLLPAAPHGQNKAAAKIDTTKEIPEKSDTKSEIKITAEKKGNLSKADKKLKTDRLIRDIHQYIENFDNPGALQALDELTLLKGEENIYLKKLKAFYYIKNKEYKKAALFLNEVLSINEKDLEAGINMAVVEVGTNQRGAAIKRLKKLLENHPVDIRLPKLISQME